MNYESYNTTLFIKLYIFLLKFNYILLNFIEHVVSAEFINLKLKLNLNLKLKLNLKLNPNLNLSLKLKLTPKCDELHAYYKFACFIFHFFQICLCLSKYN